MYESLPWHSWSPASPVAAKTVSTKTNDFGRDHSVKKQRSEIVMKIISVWEMCLLHTNWAHVLRTVLELCLPPCALLSHMFLRIPVFLGWCQGSLGLSVKNSNNAPLKKISVHFLHTRQLLMELFTTKRLRFNHYMEKKSWNEKKRCRPQKSDSWP